jgi:hypothetical protein
VLTPLALLAAMTADGQPAAASSEQAPPRLEAPQRELLNSERIERQFGSYGIDVLQSDGRYRVSNLYSVHDGERICRTFAVVLYPERIDPLFAAEHAEIVAGGSIGAVFASHDWVVTKRHLHFGELRSTSKVAALMHAAEGEPLAVHVYVLGVSKGATSLDYATISEVHHPDYLSLTELPGIYGSPAAPPQADPFLRDVLAETEARMR